MIREDVGVGSKKVVDVGKHKGKAEGKYYQSCRVVKE